ncbi:hypothetical protein [Arthrobacter sp. ISL-72]|uniref:hypothetical protein n=1 Tax=Arthrobacter sp. ISL-72 TaxID=2819114 RepID=UPI001BEAC82D|nr:hypothetical protein [Arthrobacter sp. ISL-72]MBT2597214.1 hypothetical protein [Arthrobacter sp. ISL-72]
MEITPTLLIALWGAIVSTILAFRLFWLDRTNVDVAAWLTLTKVSEKPLHHTHEIIVSIVNRGRLPVQILEVAYGYRAEGLRWSSKSNLTWRKKPTGFEAARDTKLPLAIEPGSRAEFSIWEMDEWPGNSREGLLAGVRSAHRAWITEAKDLYVS